MPRSGQNVKRGIGDDEGDIEIHSELEDGYVIIRLLTPAAVEREGAVMQHCIGQGYCDDELKNENALLLSLRDANGKPHATLVTFEGGLVQLQGNSTRPLVSLPQLIAALLELHRMATGGRRFRLRPGPG